MASLSRLGRCFTVASGMASRWVCYAAMAYPCSAQVVPVCWETFPTTACALCNQPLCVPCGLKRCCHRVVVNESGPLVTDVRVTASGGMAGFTSPVAYALCDIRLRECIGTVCVDTGIVYAVHCGTKAASGEPCP